MGQANFMALTTQPAILVVDDDPGLTKLLQMILEPMGYGVNIAHDGQSALAAMVAQRPDLMILDLMLPGGGGASFLNHLERSTHTQRIPIVVLTGMHDEETKKKILALGVKAYFKKPYSVENLLSEVKKITG